MSDEQTQTEEEHKGQLDALIDAEEAAEKERAGGLDDVAKHHEKLAADWDDPRSAIAETVKDVVSDKRSDPPNPGAIEGPGNDGVDDQGEPIVGAGTKTTPMQDGSAAPLMPPPEMSTLEQAPEEPWANLAHRLKQGENAQPSVDPLLEKMRAAGWAPAEKKPVDWAKLQADLQAAERSADSTRLVDRVLAASDPTGRLHADPNAGAGEVAAAKAALEAPREQQQMEHAQAQSEHDKLQQEAAAKATAKAAELDDPKSAASAAAREKAKALYADTGKLPPDFENYSSNQVEKFLTEVAPIAGHQSQERIAKSKEEAAAAAKHDEAAAKEKAAAEKAAAAEAAKAADVESLGAAKQLWLKTSPYAREHALTPADLADIKSRKDWEDFLKTTAKGKASHGPAAPPKEVKTLQDIADPGERALTQAVLENRTGLDGVDRKTKTRVLEMAAQIDPKFDATKFHQYEKVAEKQAASDDKMAIDVALEHLGTAEKAIPDNADAQFVNRAKQAMASGSGSAEFKPYIVASQVAAHELARVYNIGDQAGKEMVEHQLEAAQSPAQLKAAFSTLKELVSGKQKGFENQIAPLRPKPFQPAPPPPAAPQGEVKEVNGKKYRKNARGKWETVDG